MFNFIPTVGLQLRLQSNFGNSNPTNSAILGHLLFKHSFLKFDSEKQLNVTCNKCIYIQFSSLTFTLWWQLTSYVQHQESLIFISLCSLCSRNSERKAVRMAHTQTCCRENVQPMTQLARTNILFKEQGTWTNWLREEAKKKTIKSEQFCRNRWWNYSKSWKAEATMRINQHLLNLCLNFSFASLRWKSLSLHCRNIEEWK